MLGAAYATLAAYILLMVVRTVERAADLPRRVPVAAGGDRPRSSPALLTGIGEAFPHSLAARVRPDARVSARARGVRLLPPGRAEAAAGDCFRRITRLARMSGKGTAVVVEVAGSNGLAAIRSLGRQGLRVLAVDNRPYALGLRSRYAEARLAPDPLDDEDGFIEALRAIARGDRRRPPHLPHPRRAPERDRAPRRRARRALPLPVPELGRAGEDPEQAPPARDRRGGRRPGPAHALSAARPRRRAPPARRSASRSIVKPSANVGFRRSHKRQLFRCETPAELERAYEVAAPYEPMVQELDPVGGPRRCTRSAATSTADGEALGLFSGHKLSQTRGYMGSARAGEALWVDEVVEQGLALLRALDFHGISQVEMMRDPRDGRYKLLEVNPRLWQWHSLAAACGVDLPWIAYRDLVGDPLPPVRMHGDGKRWAITLMAGSGHAIERPPYVDAVFARDDPKPALVQLGRHAVRGVRTMTGAGTAWLSRSASSASATRSRATSPAGRPGSRSAATRCTSRPAASTRARASSTASSSTSSRISTRSSRVPLVRRYRMAPALAAARAARAARRRPLPLPPARTATGRRAPGSGRSSSARGGRTRSSTPGTRPRPRSARASAIAPDRALAYVVNSQALEDAAVRLGADRAKFHRIFWHARIDGYSPEHADRVRWRALGWPDDAVVCLSLRNFRPYSNLDVVLQGVRQGEARGAGAAALLERRRRLDARRVRPPRDGARDRAVHGRAGRPRRGDFPSVTASADFAVTLADVDSSPASLLETMASGVPLVVGLAPSMDEWIQQGEGGELVETGTTSTRSRPRWCASPATRSCAAATASGTSARCTRASATRPRSSSRSTARCWAGEARPRPRLRRRRLRPRPAPHGRGEAAHDLAARARGDVRAAPLDDPGLHADGVVDVPHRAQPGRPRRSSTSRPTRTAARRSSRAPRAAPARRSGACSAPAGIRSAYVGIPFTYPAEPLDGIVVTGYGGPERPQILPASAEERIFAAYPDLVTAHHPMAERWWEDFPAYTSRLLEHADQMAGVCKLVFELEPDLELLCVDFMSTDHVGHLGFARFDPEHPAHAVDRLGRRAPRRSTSASTGSAAS